METLKKNLVWVVAAGTGGHIFPGLNIVAEWKRSSPNTEFQFFGDASRLEAKIVPSYGYKIEFLSSGKWKGGGILSRLSSLFAIFKGFVQAFKKTYRQRPDCLLSVGGYVSVPLALACIARGIPYFILEPNIRAGLANRILSRFAKAVFTTPGSDAKEKMKTQVFELGNPVRADLKPIQVRKEARKILVLGGSQGALRLCRMSLELMKCEEFHDGQVELVLQTGAGNLDQAREWQKEFDVDPWTQVTPFIEDVPKALMNADLVIARAGAMTVAELAQTGMPTIFVPYPFAADNHQVVNAKILVQDGAAFMVEEGLNDAFEELRKKVHSLIGAPDGFERRKNMSEQFKKWGRPQASFEIVQKIAQLTGLK